MTLLTTACGSPASRSTEAAPVASTPESKDTPQQDSPESTTPVDPVAQQDSLLPPSTLSDRVVDLGPANGIPDPPPPSLQPVSIQIDKIGVRGARVVDVGVEPSGEMEVPPPLEVGWYQYGPAPGELGSAVLAGHIASGGIDGAFRFLDRLEPGDRFTVSFEDGSDRRFEVTELRQYDKDQLPFNQIFTDEGEPRLALITCGGAFDYSAQSYEDNVVAYAVPVTT
jgi:LPXTG-site transpeptidase (sortase) family protein